MEGLRRRLAALFLEFCQTPALNPAAAAAAASGGAGAGGGLLSVHSQLQALQARVGSHLASLSSKESMAAAGLVAQDGTVDRKAGLAAMAGLQDTLDGALQNG